MKRKTIWDLPARQCPFDGTAPMPAAAQGVTLADALKLFGAEVVGVQEPRQESKAWLRAVEPKTEEPC